VGGGWPGGPETVALTVWDAVTARRVESREMELSGYIGYGTFSPDLRWYFIGGRPLSLAGGPEFRFDLPEKWESKQAAVSPEGRLVAQVLEQHLNDGKNYWTESHLVVHEAATGKQVLTLPADQCGPIAFTADGHGLVVTDPAAITLWDLATRKPVARHKAPGRFVGFYGNSFASSLAVTPDGTRAVTGHIDTTALVWDLPPPPRRARALSDRELAAAWEDLAGGDAGNSYAAVWALADAAGDAVPFFRERLKPVRSVTDETVNAIVRRLDSAEFAEREVAGRALRDLGDAAVPALREALKGELSAEQRQRVETVVRDADAAVLPPGGRLRAVRAVAALERVGSAEARALLAEWADGLASARLTREAKAALARMR
jgi:hypothetical protein